MLNPYHTRKYRFELTGEGDVAAPSLRIFGWLRKFIRN